MRLNFALLSKPLQIAGAEGTLGTASLHAASHCPHLYSNGGDARGQRPADSIQKPAEKSDLPPLPPRFHCLWGHEKAKESAPAPGVPAAPTQLLMNELNHEMFEERAAIMEFDGGMTRAEAERLAMMLIGGI